jgi:hypothetical protein
MDSLRVGSKALPWQWNGGVSGVQTVRFGLAQTMVEIGHGLMTAGRAIP